MMFMFFGCTAKTESASLYKINFDELLRANPNKHKIDSIGLYKEPIGLLQESNVYEFDTVIRVAPYKFASKNSLMVAKLRNGQIYEYMFVYTKNIAMIQSVHGLFQADDSLDIEDTDFQFATRGYSNKAEYSELEDSLIQVYGPPEYKTDTSSLWHTKGVMIRNCNYHTTTIISFFHSNESVDVKHDWQFCGVPLDTNFFNINIGDSKTVVDRIVVSKDTTFAGSPSNRKSCVGKYKLWGLNGDLVLDYDNNDKLIRYVWQGESTGHETMIFVYGVISMFISDYVAISHPNKKEKEGSRLFTSWSNDTSSLYSLYYLPNKRIMVGRCSNDFIKTFQ